MYSFLGGSWCREGLTGQLKVEVSTAPPSDTVELGVTVEASGVWLPDEEWSSEVELSTAPSDSEGVAVVGICSLVDEVWLLCSRQICFASLFCKTSFQPQRYSHGCIEYVNTCVVVVR